MTIPLVNDEWSELDCAAMSNLKGNSLSRFWDYKRDLKADGHTWLNNAADILTGYIWDESEEVDE